MDGSLPSPCILHPLLSSLFLYLCILSFSPKIPYLYFSHSIPSPCLMYFQPLPLTSYFSISLFLPFSFSLFSLFPTAALVLPFSANLPLSFSLCLSFSGLALQCSWCWQWNTLTHQTLTRLMCLALERCHTLQISDATCQVVHQKVEDAADAWEFTTWVQTTSEAASLESRSNDVAFFG